MFFLRQGATHKVVIGPVVAVANGYVPVTTLALNTADEAEAILHDNGTVVDISAYTFAAITTADGYYHLTLQSGISGTVGHMTVVINDDSLCLPVKADFTVLEEAAYDAIYAAAAPGPATPTNITAGTITTVTNLTNLPAAAALEATAQSILTDTAEIGVAGAGLTNIGTIATVTNLTNLPAAAALEATLTSMKGATYAEATDSLEALRNRGDAAWITATGFATSAALATAQTDLDTITGTDGVTLATAQALYAPAKAGNQMDLVNAPNATAIIAIQAGLGTTANQTTIAGYLDTEIAAIKAKTDQITFTDAGKIDATLQIAADIKAAAANRIADHVLRRGNANWEASADGDALAFRSLGGAVSKLTNKLYPSGSNLLTTKSDDVTTLGTQAMTTDSGALPVTALDTA